MRQARRAVAKKWRVTFQWLREFENERQENYRAAHHSAEAAKPFLPQAEDLLRLLRALLPEGIPFAAHHDLAAVDGLLDGVKMFLPLPETYADGLKARFSEAFAVLRREQSTADWLN